MLLQTPFRSTFIFGSLAFSVYLYLRLSIIFGSPTFSVHLHLRFNIIFGSATFFLVPRHFWYIFGSPTFSVHLWFNINFISTNCFWFICTFGSLLFSVLQSHYCLTFYTWFTCIFCSPTFFVHYFISVHSYLWFHIIFGSTMP